MTLVFAYLAVILVWSTTPLAIVWSSASISPSMALLLRMMIALILALIIAKAANVRLPWHKAALQLYCYSAIGIAGGMFFTYLAASSVPSGLISLVFGLSPLLSGVFSQLIIKEKPLTLIKKIALLMAFSGLLIVCFDNLSMAKTNVLGLLYVFTAVLLFSLSGVMVKSVELTINPLASTIGTLLVTMPFFILAWWIMDGSFTVETWTAKSIWSIVYLGVFGSLLGFMAYFYVLQRLSASTVSLVTLITPTIAIALGSQLNNEVISQQLIMGAMLILLGLVFYLFGHKAVWNFPVNTMK